MEKKKELVKKEKESKEKDKKGDEDKKSKKKSKDIELTDEQKKEREVKANEAMKRIAAESEEQNVIERLAELEKELRRTLSLKDADHNKCIKVLQDITDLPLTPALLMKNKTIIPTMKKVKAYKASPKVSEKAAQLYYHYKSLFAIGGTGGNVVKTQEIKTQVQINININNHSSEKVEEVPVTITQTSNVL